MKYLILTLLFSTFAYSQAPDCDENGNPLNAMAELATPNCLNPNYIEPAVKGDIQKLCNECRPKFQKFFDRPIGELKKEEKKEQFIDTALKEYQKNLTENLLESMKLRAMRPTGSSFEKSIEACKMKNISSFSNQCNSKFTINYLEKSKVFNEFNKSISVELSKILAKEDNYFPQNALLKRNAPNCFIPEKDILYIQISALEEVLTPEMMTALASLDPKQFNSVEDIFYDDKIMSLYAGEDISEIVGSFKTHPLLSDKFNSPASLTAFFKSIKDPKNVDNLRALTYDKINGDNFDTKLAAKCDESFKSLKEAICSKDFEEGKFELNPVRNFEKLYAKKLKTSDEQFSTSEELEKNNFELLKLCEPVSPKQLGLTALNNKVSKSLNPNYLEHSLESYKTEKHEKDIGKINNNLCQRKVETCSDNSYSCKMLLKYKEILNPSSLDFKLANSSNKEVNTLLRSMIGDTSQIDPKTKAILIAQGIIPQDNGELIAQEDIPERKPEFFAQNQSQNRPQAQTATLASNASRRSPASVREDSSNSISNQSANYNNLGQNSSLPDISDLIKDQEEEFKGFQDELRRRLTDLPRPSNLADATKVVQASSKKSGKRISPVQERAFAERIMQPAPTAPQPQIANVSAQTPATENRAAVSNTDSQLDKWKKGQKDAALMGMAGAQAVTSKDIINSANASEARPKDMTKVALNIAEDPRVTLSEIFNNKIDQNDSETQLLKVLLRNKNNFLLQVKSLNFKVVFDGRKGFNVLLESGDKSEAERIRPQLEMFLKKLRV